MAIEMSEFEKKRSKYYDTLMKLKNKVPANMRHEYSLKADYASESIESLFNQFDVLIDSVKMNDNTGEYEIQKRD